MAVTTKIKRRAAVRFGMAHLATTRSPSRNDSFVRGMMLGCYSMIKLIFIRTVHMKLIGTSRETKKLSGTNP